VDIRAELFWESYVKVIQEIQFFNDTITWIVLMFFYYVSEQLISKILSSHKFAIQVNELTDVSNYAIALVLCEVWWLLWKGYFSEQSFRCQCWFLPTLPLRLPWVMYADITFETVVHFLILSHGLSLNTISNALTQALQIINSLKKNVQHCQLKFSQCRQHSFYSSIP
jgi:hypothetical protein